MADIKQIRVGGSTYDVKDDVARTLAQEAKNATDNLGSLAYQDSASGSITPAGTVSKPDITLTGVTRTVRSCTNAGSLPSWSAAVNNEILSFTFNAGTLPTLSDVSINNVSGAALDAAPVFTGTAANVTVS